MGWPVKPPGQLRSRPLPPGTRLRQSRPADTGFSAKVRLDTRTRAGGGDPEDARCEATGVWLGPYGGEIQHRVARLSGGRGPKAPWWFHTAANAVLLSAEAHRVAESRDEGMRKKGFWLKWSGNPLLKPVTLYNGEEKWLAPDGTYTDEPAGGAA
jgi:hypothetical protein